jgi:hypothetical protein
MNLAISIFYFFVYRAVHRTYSGRAASRTPRSGGGYERSLGTLEVHGKATVANSVERCLKVLLG